MMRTQLLLCLIMAFTPICLLSGQVPNDNLCDATLITINEECSAVNIVPEGASAEANEPLMLCDSIFSLDSVVFQSVWFRFVAPAGEIILQADTDTIASIEDYTMNVFELNGDCADLSNLVKVDCDVPSQNLMQSPRIVSTFTEGNTYYIQIAPRHYSAILDTFMGPGCMTVTEVVTPLNDDACNAIPLEFDAMPQIFSNQGASAQPGETAILPPVSGNPFGFDPDGWALADLSIEHSVWFTFTTPKDQSNVTVDLYEGFFVGGNMNAQVAIYEVGDCSDFSTYKIVGAGDNALRLDLGIAQAFPQVQVPCLKANTTYYVLVDGAESFIGSETRKEGNFAIEIRYDGAAATKGTISTADSTLICTDDGIVDLLNVNLEDGFGGQSEWLITDTALNILDLPGAPPFNFEGQDEGVSLIWHMYYDDISPLDIGVNVDTLSGCFDLSNSIRVQRLTGENCIITNVPEVVNEAEINLFPNPASGLLEVSLPANSSHSAFLTIRDLHGKPIFNRLMNSTYIQVDISALPSGLYVLEVSYESGSSIKQFLKTHD